MVKKIFCLIVVLSMIFSLAACKPQVTVVDIQSSDINQIVDEQSAETVDDADIAAPGTVDKVSDVKPGDDAWVDTGYKVNTDYTNKPHVDISIGGLSASFDMNNDQLGKDIQNKFKFSIDNKLMPAEKVLLLAAQDELPDIFALNLNTTTFEQLNQQNFLYHIDKSQIANYPLLTKYFNNHQYLNAYLNMSTDKKYVGMPFAGNTWSPVTDYTVSFYYRKDWAKNVNYDINIDTMDKVYNLMKKFREDDPDKNGYRDTYGFTGSTWAFHWATWVDTEGWAKEEDPTNEFYGKYVPGFLNSKCFDAITWWNRLLKEQIMPADFYLTGWQQSIDKLVANQVGVAYGNSGEYWLWENLVNKFDPAHKEYYTTLPKIDGRTQTAADVVSEFPPLKADENSQPRFPYKPETGIRGINANISPDKLERLFDFYEWTMTREGADFLSYGVEGRDYVVDKNGLVIQKLPSSSTTAGAMKKIWEVYPSVQIGQLVSWASAVPSKPKTAQYPQWIVDRNKATQEEKNKYTITPSIAINNILTPTKAMHLDMFGSLWFEDKINRVIAEENGKSIKQGWEDFRKECLDNKEGRKIINEVNDEIKARGLG